MSERPPETTLTPEEAAKQRAVSYLGRVISKRYRIDEVIAMGGMGAVYRGEHVHMHKRVAIKILHPDTERLPELVQRFEREAIAGAHIQHRNVATATDFGEAEDGSFFLVLEYVRGTTLHEIIRRGPMPAARAALIARQIAAALGATHAMSIVHRDVKPRNVMVVEPQGDLVKLIDFGLAKVSVDQLRRSVASPESTRMEGESLPVRLTTAGVIFGTIAYLAPESALGMDFVDERADLYALGLIFYEMLAGKHPFLARDPVELFNQQRSAPVPAIAEHAPGVAVPPAIEAVVRRLLEKQPRARFESAAELIAALDAACAASGIVMDEPRAEMGSRAEMTSVPAIGEAARVPSNRPPLPSAAPSPEPSNRPPPLPSAAPSPEPSNRPPPLPSAAPPREPEAGSGGSSAILLGDSCLVSLTDVVDELEPAAQRGAGDPAGGNASAPGPARAGDEASAEPAEGEDEEDVASHSRPTPVRNTPTLVAELTRDSRPTAVGGAAFMAQVAFSRQESAGDAPAEVEAAPLSSDSRPTAVGGAAFMAQVAFSREEAARDAASAAGAPLPRSGEQTASQEPAPLVSTPPLEEAPSVTPAEPVRSLEEPAPEEREGSASTRPPMGATSTEPSEHGRSAPSPEKPSQPGTAELPAHAGERASSKPPSSPAAGPASSTPPSSPATGPASSTPPSASAGERATSKPPSASAGERASSKPPSASAGERASSKPPSASAGEAASSKPPSASAGERASSKLPSSPAGERASSKPPSSPAAEAAAPSKLPSSPAGERATSKPPSSPEAEAAPSKPPSSLAAEAAPSKPPSSLAAEAAPSKPPSSLAAEAAPSKPPSSLAAEVAPSKPPAPSVEDPASPATSQPPEKAPPPAATAASQPSAEEEDAPASEPTSERMSGSRPAFAPTLLRELEAAEAERVAREREEEAKRKLAEEAERAAKEREEKARRKRAAQEARASRRRDEGAGGRLGRLAPYLGGALIAVGVIAALASSGRAPPEPEPQLGQAAPAASALATSEPAPADAAAAPEASGPTAAAPEDAAQASPAAPEAPAEPPPDEATRKALTDAARARRWVKAAEALNLLAERDPTALRERPIAIAARNLAIAISKTGEELADQVFDALARRFGTAGLDVLYEIVETRGRSTPATRAAKLLRDPEVAARGTPAVRISFELRDATCGEKMPFLDRAVSEGDQRTLVVLETAVRPCYTKNRTIDEAIKKLRARLEGG
ncbi:protein kinase domain-containing protein [Sorangium sp. So ce861]|uniref:serine/threonine-protein kinase n=1 Tax=Sorangium sp. So ce861 TaxID=3133323 RepID=UPI003F5DAB67